MSRAEQQSQKSGFETRAIHAGYEPDPTTGAVVPPIYATSTYKQDGVGGLRGGYEYSRSANPTRTALEECLAALEEGEPRASRSPAGWPPRTPCCARCAGPATTWSSPTTRTAAPTGCSPRSSSPGASSTRPPPVADVDAVRAAIRPGKTKVVWVETPTNPLLGIADIAALAAVAHDAGALLVVDNTFASPYLQQPLDARRRRRRALDDEVHAAATPTSSAARWSSATLDAGRARSPSTRTRSARSPARSTPGWCCAASRRSACGWTGTATTPSGSSSSCSGHPAVSQVLYPGLPEHPGHEVAAKQMKRFGGMVSFRVAGGEEEALEVCDRAEVFTLGESLGGVESLIEHPGRMTHASVAGTDARGARRPGPAVASASRRSTTCSPTSTRRSAERDGLTSSSASTSGRRSPRRRWSTCATGRAGRDGEPPHHDRHRRARRLGRLPRPSWPQVDRGAADAEVLACSSAGGGLRIARRRQRGAGHRRGRPPGGAVQRRPGGARRRRRPRRATASPTLRASRARRGAAGRRHRRRQRRGAARLRDRAGRGPLAAARWWWPATSTPATRSAALLDGGGTPYVLADNVVPRIGVLAPGLGPGRDPGDVPAPRDRRQAPVAGAPTSPRWSAARPPTWCSPRVELLADGSARTGPAPATWWSSTSAARPPTCTPWSSSTREDAGPRPRGGRDRPGHPHRRGRPRHAVERGVDGRGGRRRRAPRRRGAGRRAARGRGTPGRPGVPAGRRRASRRRRAALAAAPSAVALRRHAGRQQVVFGPDGRVVERSGKDLREVDLLVGSGGVLRHAPTGVGRPAARLGHRRRADGGWQLPEHPRVVVDRDYVLAPAGLLAERHPEAAYAAALAPASVTALAGHTLSGPWASASHVRQQGQLAESGGAEAARGPVRRAVRGAQFAQQWAQVRAERQPRRGAGRAGDRAGPSNFSRAQVP